MGRPIRREFNNATGARSAPYGSARRAKDGAELDASVCLPYDTASEFTPPAGAFAWPKGNIMSRRCELTGKSVLTGNLVSHSNHKTKTRFLPNLSRVRLTSEALNRSVRLRVAAAALRSVEHRGGLDAFLLKARDTDLSPGALALKREIQKKQAS